MMCDCLNTHDHFYILDNYDQMYMKKSDLPAATRASRETTNNLKNILTGVVCNEQ